MLFKEEASKISLMIIDTTVCFFNEGIFNKRKKRAMKTKKYQEQSGEASKCVVCSGEEHQNINGLGFSLLM